MSAAPSSDTKPKRERLITADGSYNIDRKGLPRRGFGRDAYHHLLSLSWTALIAYITFVYAFVNSLFAGAYLLLGDAIENARPGSFEDAFFFSVQTMATIGYGKLVPSGFAANVLVTIESVLGMLTVAVLTGLLFAKFSRPTARVVFSRNVVITKHDGVPSLLFRVANERESMIVEAKMRVVIVRAETTAEGKRMRRFHDLALTRSETPIFPLSWLVIHRLDETSPLYDLSLENWEDDEIEIICALAGIEESLSQLINVRYSYVADDLRFDHQFIDIISIGADGRRILDYTQFHAIAPNAPEARV